MYRRYGIPQGAREGGAVMSMEVRTDILLLGNCSCITLLPSIHGHMHCPTTCHPWQYPLVIAPWMGKLLSE